MNNNLQKLKKLTEEIDELIQNKATPSSDDFQLWKHRSERLIEKIFGNDSKEAKELNNVYYSPIVYFSNMVYDEAEYCRDGLKKVKVYFIDYISELEEDDEDEVVTEISDEDKDYSKIFIVHGHDEAVKQKVARVLEHQGIEPIILHEQANQGATIIEKFEKNSDVGAAICLFTADDLGHAKKETEERARARQNVVFETGFFMGKLGRDHIVIIADQGVEIPSDMSGVVYSNSQVWEIELCQELKAMGFAIDMNKLF